MPARKDPRTFDPARPIAMGIFRTVGGHALGPGDPLKIAEDPKERGEVDLDTATRLWASGTFVYAEEARPTPVESPQDAARRLVAMEELPNSYFLIRAPWLAEGEKIHGREAAEARRDELIEAGQPTAFTGVVVTDSPMAGTGEGVQLPGAVDAGGEPLPPIQPFQLAEAGSNGWFEITGPGLDEPLKVRGEAAAQAKLAELQGGPPAPTAAAGGESGGAATGAE